MSLILPDLPTILRETLMDSIKLAFENTVVEGDSESEAEFFRFLTLHFSWYNRYTVQVSPTSFSTI